MNDTTICTVCLKEIHYSNFPTCEVCGEPMHWDCHDELNGLCSEECFQVAERDMFVDFHAEEFEIARRGGV